MCKSEGRTIEQGPSVRAERLVKDIQPVDKAVNDDIVTLRGLCAGGGLSVATVVFSLHLPFIIQPREASAVYHPAFYSYDSRLSFFDNSAWTYMTDYVLAVIMSVLAYRCASAQSDRVVLKRRACGLFVCYAISVTAGGLAHQFYTTLESMNSVSFRVLWTICVGTVTAAGGLMGACAAEMSTFLGLYRISGWFWAGFAILTTLFCAGGMMSFQRPAADIFVAGITQFPSTCAIVEAALKKYWQGRISLLYTCMCVVGFALNAPLLPLYAFLLFHTTWSLAAVNTLLHCWLCITWVMQAVSLRYFIGLFGDEKKA